ncbi:peptidylprolyl isomerase [Ramlibacter sp. USB13]|uniref:Peptidyl-prolyl cis-trans isomerase n=1 Tax=Ramlibacter cellulosilyticus TaxID=2764187 RepID=A0A923MWG9_9BURK|nr:peptidylprolyl isomerase [Ramlibacter cellulosilyticus]MBC5785017.1 peptidylprolyl isomerase [Ramlibacter cellulosilyticus]
MLSVTRRLAAATILIGCLAGSAWSADAPKVKLVTSAGDIVVEVYPDKAPKTAENFLQYVRDRHYDGTIFHRVINGFMIQGGGMDAKMVEKKTRAPVAHEGRDAYAKGLRNEVGTIAMARTSDPNSATSQFFINVADNTRTLDPPGPNAPGYTVFGRVVSGMDVVNKIKAVPTGSAGMHGDVPLTPVVIQSATIVQ